MESGEESIDLNHQIFLKKYKNTKTGFLIGHGEVLPNNKNTVSLSKSTDQYDISIPHISIVWRENEKKWSQK